MDRLGSILDEPSRSQPIQYTCLFFSRLSWVRPEVCTKGLWTPQDSWGISSGPWLRWWNNGWFFTLSPSSAAGPQVSREFLPQHPPVEPQRGGINFTLSSIPLHSCHPWNAEIDCFNNQQNLHGSADPAGKSLPLQPPGPSHLESPPLHPCWMQLDKDLCCVITSLICAFA